MTDIRKQYPDDVCATALQTPRKAIRMIVEFLDGSHDPLARLSLEPLPRGTLCRELLVVSVRSRLARYCNQSGLNTLSWLLSRMIRRALFVRPTSGGLGASFRL